MLLHIAEKYCISFFYNFLRILTNIVTQMYAVFSCKIIVCIFLMYAVIQGTGALYYSIRERCLLSVLHSEIYILLFLSELIF